MINDSVLSASNKAYQEILNIKIQYQYEDIPENFYIGDFKDTEYFQAKYFCHDNALVLNEVNKKDCAIVTGFGPTNTPTAGTLSVMMKAISLQKETGIYTDIIISDLGAWNSRNLSMKELELNTNKFIEFISMLDFNYNNGCVRSHRDLDNLIISGTISKIMHEKDFKENKEATDELYDLMNLRGSFLGIMVDGLYTISDILKPLFFGKKRVLVLAGIEEHYFARLARVAVERLKDQYSNEFIDNDSKIGALYARLIEGLYPYPKMSKSIPESAINIADSTKELERKILKTDKANERIILQMIELVSDWSNEKISMARKAFENRELNPNEWRQVKEEYFEFFNDISNKWKKIEKKYGGL